MKYSRPRPSTKDMELFLDKKMHQSLWEKNNVEIFEKKKDKQKEKQCLKEHK